MDSSGSCCPRPPLAQPLQPQIGHPSPRPAHRRAASTPSELLCSDSHRLTHPLDHPFHREHPLRPPPLPLTPFHLLADLLNKLPAAQVKGDKQGQRILRRVYTGKYENTNFVVTTSASEYQELLDLFRGGRHLMKAAHYRRFRTRAFATWREVTCVHHAA